VCQGALTGSKQRHSVMEGFLLSVIGGWRSGLCAVTFSVQYIAAQPCIRSQVEYLGAVQLEDRECLLVLHQPTSGLDT